jgi:hypothetical protein
MIHTTKTSALIITIAIALLASAYASHTGSARLKSIVITSAGKTLDSSVATYNASGKLQSIDGPGSSIHFAYSADTIYQSFSDGKQVVYILNRKGLAAYDSEKKFYYYDEQGFLISTKSGITVLRSNTVANGDIVTSSFPWGRNERVNCTYTFYPQSDTRNRAMPFLGRSNTHLIKTEIDQTGGQSDTINYTYTYGPSGMVLSETQTSKKGALTTSYTYEP